MPFCPRCGRESNETDTFCPSCGASLRQAANSSPVIPFAKIINRPDNEASTAKTLTLVAIIIQILFVIFIGIVAAGLGAFSNIVTKYGTITTTGVTATFPGTTVSYSNPFSSTSFTLGFAATILGIGVVVSIVWIVFDYFLVYKNLNSPATIHEAKTPALVLGILQTLFGGVLPGILLFVSYLKIGESINNKRQMSNVRTEY